MGGNGASVVSRDLLDQVPDPVLVSDAEGRYVYANPAAVEAFGYSLEELLSMGSGDLLTQDRSWAERERGRLLRDGRWRGTFEARRKDGAVRAFEGHAGAVESPEGPHYVAVLREISVGAAREAMSLAQFGVVRILYEAASLEEAAPELLRTLCEGLRWDVGELWVTGLESAELGRLATWSNPHRDLAALLEAIGEIPMDQSVPGRVWRSAEPAWISDLQAEPGSPGGASSDEDGIRSAVGIPLLSGRELLGVLALYDRSARERDEELISYLLPLGGQLGQYLARIRADAELRVSRDQLEAILQGVGDGITVQGPNGELLFANEYAANAIGFDDPEELLRTPVTEVLNRFELLDDRGHPMPFDRLPGRRALAGEQGAQELVRFRVRETGEERWSLVTASPVFDEDGRVKFAINIFQDVTARRRLEDAQRFLGEASAMLGSSLDYQSTLTGVAQLAVSNLADWCVVFVIEPGGLRQLEVAHADPSKTELVRRLQELYPFDETRPGLLRDVLDSGKPVLIPEVTREMLQGSARDEKHFGRLVQLGFRSAMVVPIRAAERVLGAVAFISAESSRRYDSNDLATAEELARRAGLAMEHARLYRERTRVAETLQRSLLPPALPRIPGMEMAARYHSAVDGIGGDFYDVFATGSDSWGIVVGDVCGRGAAAAAMTSLARYTVRTAATGEPSPGAALKVLNRLLLESEQDPEFCTLAVARLWPADGGMDAVISSGGHPRPLLVHDGAVEEVGGTGTLVGMVEEPEFRDEPVRLRPGDLLFLYTDGLVERKEDGPGRLQRLLASCSGMEPEAIAERIHEELVVPGPARDDVAFLVARVAEAPTSGS
jgi:PAS domain S-box-containing protein